MLSSAPDGGQADGMSAPMGAGSGVTATHLEHRGQDCRSRAPSGRARFVLMNAAQ
jgi:hypothetical protein